MWKLSDKNWTKQNKNYSWLKRTQKCLKMKKVCWLKNFWNKLKTKQVKKIAFKKKWQTKYHSFCIPSKNWKLILKKVNKFDMKIKVKCFKSNFSFPTSKLKDKPWKSTSSKKMKSLTKWNRKFRNIGKMCHICLYNHQTSYQKNKEKTTMTK